MPILRTGAISFKDQQGNYHSVDVVSDATTEERVAAVTQAGTKQTELVASEGTKQVNLVTTQGTKQIGLIQSKGKQVTDSIPDNYTQLEQSVVELKSDLSDFQEPFIGKIIKQSENLIRGFVNGAVFNNGTFVPASQNPSFATWWTTDYIEVESSERYVISQNGNVRGVSTSAVYGADKSFVGGQVFSGQVATIPAGGKYIRFSIEKSVKPQTVQFQRGTNITPYEPFGKRELLIDVDNIVYKQDQFVELVECDNLYGAYMENAFIEETSAFHGYATKVFDVSNIDNIKLNGVITRYVNAITMLDKNMNVLSFVRTAEDKTYDMQLFDVSGADFVAVSSNADKFWNTNRVKLLGNKTIDGRWHNKKIVWFGTSIPAAGFKGNANDYGYPYLVGRMLGAKVFNEAVGSSPLHSRQLARVSETNPYGFMTSFEPASRALCNTVQQMQWIANWIDYKLNGGTYKNSEAWDDSVFTHGLPSKWTASDTADLISFSYENKLDQYLNADNFPDLFVIDHGYNDDVNWSDEQGYYERDFAKYGRYNPFTFQGAANFIIDRILTFNPHAKIVMIGCYDKTLPTKANVYKWQLKVADDNQIPILKTWEKSGLNQTTLSLHGKWVDGLWQKTTTAQNYTVMNARLPDTVHPHSDKSGRELRFLADIIMPFIKSN